MHPEAPAAGQRQARDGASIRRASPAKLAMALVPVSGADSVRARDTDAHFAMLPHNLLIGHDCIDGAPIVLDGFARARHTYIIGQTGAGKSTLIANIIAQDLAAGAGLVLIDPHGDLARDAVGLIPSHRAHELVYIDPADLDRPVGFNPLANVAPDDRALVADNIVSAFRHVWADSWGPRLEYLLLNALRTLLELDRPTLLMLPRLLTDETWRGRRVKKLQDPLLKSFWFDEFADYSDRFKSEALSPVLNKVNRLLASPAIRNILAQPTPTFDIPFMLARGRILIVNLSKGRIGEGPSHLLGALIVSAITQAALARAALPAADRRPFALFADEFHAYVTDSFQVVLSEARKYGLSLTLANQFLDQMPEPLRAAILANVATLVSFRISPDDAIRLAPHYDWPNPAALSELPNFEAAVRSLDRTSRTHARTITLQPPPRGNQTAIALMRNSSIRFGTSRRRVELAVAAFLATSNRL